MVLFLRASTFRIFTVINPEVFGGETVEINPGLLTLKMRKCDVESSGGNLLEIIKIKGNEFVRVLMKITRNGDKSHLITRSNAKFELENARSQCQGKIKQDFGFGKSCFDAPIRKP